MIPIWIAPIALMAAVGCFAVFVATIANNEPPTLQWSRKYVLRPGFGAELNGKRYDNTGSNPVEIIPLSDGETVVIKASLLAISVQVTP